MGDSSVWALRVLGRLGEMARGWGRDKAGWEVFIALACGEATLESIMWLPGFVRSLPLGRFSWLLLVSAEAAGGPQSCGWPRCIPERVEGSGTCGTPEARGGVEKNGPTANGTDGEFRYPTDRWDPFVGPLSSRIGALQHGSTRFAGNLWSIHGLPRGATCALRANGLTKIMAGAHVKNGNHDHRPQPLLRPAHSMARSDPLPASFYGVFSGCRFLPCFGTPPTARN
jgi:hypothetical protein